MTSPVSSSRPQMISVVMPTLNGEETIAEQLEALASQSYQGLWELVVTDNASSDRTLELVRAWEPHLPAVRVVDVPERRGISYSCNVGARGSAGDFIVWCHQDDVAESQWLSGMAESARHYDVVGGRLEVRALNDPLTLVWRPPQPDRLPVAMSYLPYAVGANLGMWRGAFDQLGGWSEEFRQGCEDIDLCWRAQHASLSFGYAPDAVMHYRYRSGLRSLWNQTYQYGFAEPKLYKIHRQNSLRRSSTRVALKTWAWAVWHVRDMFGSEEAKGHWVRQVAYRWGRFRGSLNNRVVYL